MSSAASIRSASSRPPAIRPARRVRGLGDLGVAQLGALRRVEDPRGLGPDGRPARRRRAPSSVALRGVGQVRARPSRAAPLRSSGVSSAANVVSIGATRCSKASCCSAAMRDRVLGREVVLRARRRSRPPRARPSVWTSLSKSTRARRDDVARWRARRPATSSGASGRMSAPRIAVRTSDEDPGRDREARASLRVKRAIGSGALGQHGSVIGRAWPQCVPPSWAARSAWREGLGDELAHDACRRRGRGSAATSQPMTLPMSRADVAPVAAMRLVDERGDLGLGQRLRAGTRRGSRSRPPPWRRGPRGRRPGTPRPTRGGS